MKRIKLALALIVCMLVLGTYSLYELKNTKNKLISKLTDISLCVSHNDDKGALDKSVLLNSYWKAQEPLLSIFFRRHQLEEITSTAAELPVLIQYGDKSLFSARCSRIAATIESVWHSELPLFQNIL